MVLRAPRDLGARDVDRPTPGHDQALVRVTHSGVCGTDLKIYKGAILVRHPLIMGHEMIGELVEAGDDQFRLGERVLVDPGLYCGRCFNCRAGQTNLCPNGVLLGRDANGGFAEYVMAPCSHVFPLPDAIDSRRAPLLQVVTVCIHGQRLVDVVPGQSVVVVGLGVAGQLHVQLAKARGAYPVIGITRSEWKRRLAEDFGADITLPSGADGVRGVSEATSGQGADVIIESTGQVSAIADAISMARLGATLLLFGITTVTEGALPFYQLYFKELTIVNSRAAKSEDFPAAIDLVARGVVKLEPLVTHVVSLTELERAIHMLESDEDRRLKIILENT
jgi:L-iditol 2-dehydrogenase